MVLLIAIVIHIWAGQALVRIENRATNVVVYVTGGESNQQYWVVTSNDYIIDSTNWFEWRRFYSSDFATNTAVPVYDPTYPTNTASGKPMRFFKMGGPVTNQ